MPAFVDESPGKRRHGAFDAASPLGGSVAPQGAAWRVVHDGGSRLRTGRSRRDRDGSRSACAGGHRARVSQVRRVRQYPSGSPVATPRRHRAARGALRTIAAQDGLEAAGLQRRSSRIDQPDLRRRLPARGESRRSERVGVDGGDRVPYTERAWRWARNRRCDRRRRCG